MVGTIYQLAARTGPRVKDATLAQYFHAADDNRLENARTQIRECFENEFGYYTALDGIKHTVLVA